MPQPPERQLGTIGEAAVKLAFLKLNCGPIEVPQQHDVGTDLMLIVRDDQLVERGLLGVQVKTGESHFGEIRRDGRGAVIGWWFRCEKDRAQYWLTHTLPHILVLHDERTGESYWAALTRQSMVATGKGVKVFVPIDNCLEFGQSEALISLLADKSVRSSELLSRRTIKRQADYALIHNINLALSASQRSVDELNYGDLKVAFAADLTRLHGFAGAPPVEILSNATGCDAAAICNYLSGKHVPSTGRVLALVGAMAQYSRDNGFEISDAEIDPILWSRKCRVLMKPGMRNILINKVKSHAKRRNEIVSGGIESGPCEVN